MQPLKPILTIVALVFVAITLSSSFFTLTEGQQAIITQFGRPVGQPVTQAGPHLKMPFVQEVTYVDKRILTWDGHPNQIPTKDKKYISVDTTARWQITDALKFIQSVQNERGAKARLDSILDANIRDVISKNHLVEAVRNTNTILENAQKSKGEVKDDGIDDEIFGEIEPITTGREELSQIIAKNSEKELAEFGIKIIDVQLRRISYEKSVEGKVYERMISERKRVAEKIRSIGNGEKAKIEGRLSRDLQEIESKAYQSAMVIQGKGEALSMAIYAKALSKDPGFYEFVKSMETYEAVLGAKTKLLMSSDSEFLKWLRKSP